jgi:hypothetical protein
VTYYVLTFAKKKRFDNKIEKFIWFENWPSGFQVYEKNFANFKPDFHEPKLKKTFVF